MKMAAGWVEKIWADGKRLKPREVVAEFDSSSAVFSVLGDESGIFSKSSEF